MLAVAGRRQSWTEMIMGLPVSVHLRDVGDPPVAESAVQEAFGVLRAADAMFSPFNSGSVLSKFNRGEVALDDTPAPFRLVLGLAEQARQLTDGAFDVRLGGQLDPCGIVKGWAAEAASDVLPGNHYLNAGGDLAIRSIAAPWRIGIEHPEHPTGLLAVLQIRTGAVATSGSLHRGAHIIDPATGEPAAGVRQVTVVGPKLVTADIWATALVARGNRIFNRADPLISRMVSLGYHALIVGDDGIGRTTAGFAASYAPDAARPITARIG